jgi:phosphate-selective porin OprO/OprP
VTDLWWTFTDLPAVGNIRVGNQKEAIGFEHLVSSRWLPFMERSYNQDTFYGGLFNGFTPGISAFNNYADERGLWQIGLYKPTDNVFAQNANDGEYAVTGRLTYLPMDWEDECQLLHVGSSVRLASTVDERARFRTRDAIRSGVSVAWPVPADTGELVGETNNLLNLSWWASRGLGLSRPNISIVFCPMPARLPAARTLARSPTTAAMSKCSTT